MGNPSCHPYYFWIFPSKPFSYWGTPMTMETNGYGQTLHEAQFFCTQKDGKDTLYHLVAVRSFLGAFRWGWGNSYMLRGVQSGTAVISVALALACLF